MARTGTTGKARAAMVIGVLSVIVGLALLGQTHKYSTNDPTFANVTCGSVFGGASSDANGSGFGSSQVGDFCDGQRRQDATRGGVAIGVGILLIIGSAIAMSNQIHDSSS